MLLDERVASAGVYEVRVTVTSHASSPAVVRLQIGARSRRAVTRGRRHSITVRSRVAVRGHRLRIRATNERRVAPLITVSWHRVRAAHKGAKPRRKPATGATGATGSTGPTGTLAAAVPAAATGATGTEGSTGANGSTGGGAPSGPLALPAGFAPVADYTTLARDYEFTGSALPSDWSVGNQSYGFSSTHFAPSQVSMTGSSVALTASNQASGGKPYTSGWIMTSGHFTLTHGMIDFRARMPAGQGLWSGLWLMSPMNTTPGEEIDIQEMLLANTHIVNGSLHDWQPWGTDLWNETQYTTMAADASAGYHDYQLIWQPGMLTWAVDGVAYAQYTAQQAAAAGHPWPYDSNSPVYLIADLAVGGANDWGGAPNAATPFPSSMQIQSVKVWQ